MLPGQVSILIREFRTAHELQNQGGFQKDSQTVLNEACARGWAASGSTLVSIKKAYAKRIEARGHFLLETMSRVITSTSLARLIHER